MFDSMTATARDIRDATQAFVRRFGLLADQRTPCKQPISLAQAHALMALLQRERRAAATTVCGLAAELGVDKSNASRIVQRMARAGQVGVERCDDDGRVKLLALTGKGRRLAARLDAASISHFEQMVSHIESSRRHGVLDALRLLCAAIASTGGTDDDDQESGDLSGGRDRL